MKSYYRNKRKRVKCAYKKKKKTMHQGDRKLAFFALRYTFTSPCKKR